jgi:ribosomal protein L11 methyltransferase
MSVSADHEAVEAVSEILSRATGGPVAIEAPFELVDDGLAAHIDTSKPVTVRAYVPAAHAGAVTENARRDLGHLQAFGLRPIGELETRLVQEEDWAEAWKSHFPVLRVGRRLVIKPTWRDYDPNPADVVIALDPGMAFGTGLHPTTRLCLAALEHLADAGHVGGARVLDVGSGSGILSVVAALLGAASVVAVDTDPVAVDSTRANVDLNGLDTQITTRRGSAPAPDGPFDLVLANLIASLLVDLAESLRQSVVAGGRLVASGIFIDREAEVMSALQAVGLEVVNRWSEAEWIALEAVAE